MREVELLFFNPELMLKFRQKDDMLLPNSEPTKVILKAWKKSNFCLFEREYDDFLKFISYYGLSIEVEQIESWNTK